MKDVRQRSRLRERRRSRRNIFLIGIGICTMIVFGGVIYSIHHPALRVDVVVVSGEEVIREQEIKDLVTQTLFGSWLFLIPKDSIIFLPKRAIERVLYAHVPRIAEVEISRTSLKSIDVQISERALVGTWCATEDVVEDMSLAEEKKSRCFLFDDTGFLFAETYVAEGVRVTAPLRDDTEAMRNILISDGAYSQIMEMSRALETLVGRVQAIVYREPDEVDLILESGMRVTYLFGKEGDARAYLGSTTLSDAFRPETIEYIDLRFLPKVYVKRKE